MLNTFLEAAIPEPTRCCGVHLLPYSLGRLFALRRFCPTYLTPDKPRDFLDLLTSCLICSQPYKDTVEMFCGRVVGVDEYLRKWTKRLGKDKQFNFTKSSAVFDRYLSKAQESYPVVKVNTEQGFASSDPSLWPFVTMIGCMKAGQKLDDVLEQPISLSRWIVAGYGITEGGVEIADGSDLAQRQAEADKFEAEFRAKGGA